MKDCLTSAGIIYNLVATALTYYADEKSSDALFAGAITMFSVEPLGLIIGYSIYKYCTNRQEDESDYVEMTEREAEEKEQAVSADGHESEGEHSASISEPKGKNETKHSESNIFIEQQNTPEEQQTTPQQNADLENQFTNA